MHSGSLLPSWVPVVEPQNSACHVSTASTFIHRASPETLPLCHQIQKSGLTGSFLAPAS